jgi:hypothetical protein
MGRLMRLLLGQRESLLREAFLILKLRLRRVLESQS